MNLLPTTNETILGLSRAILAGELSCMEVLERCLATVDQLESQVHAWVLIDVDGSRHQASILDRELRDGHYRGPLHGVPVGIKDIIDVAGQPTSAGFRLWEERIVETDSPIVGSLKRSGAILLGKTVTTQFAWIDPPKTRNPWNFERTPGGSSSGSAAAVATGMCLGAVGTQTGGSVIRPASYCGIVGFKPRFGGLPTEGIVPFAESLDTPGLFARSICDISILYREILLNISQVDKSLSGTTSSFAPQLNSKRPARVFRLSGFITDRVDPFVNAAIDQAIQCIASHGIEVGELILSEEFADIHRTHRIIMSVEGAQANWNIYHDHREEMFPKIRALVEEGRATDDADYRQAIENQKILQSKFTSLVSSEGLTWFLLPSTLGPAPETSTTGDPWMNSPFTLLGSPVFTIPIGLDPDGLPLGLQLIAVSNRVQVGDPLLFDERVFQEALWFEQAIQNSILS